MVVLHLGKSSCKPIRSKQAIVTTVPGQTPSVLLICVTNPNNHVFLRFVGCIVDYFPKVDTDMGYIFFCTMHRLHVFRQNAWAACFPALGKLERMHVFPGLGMGRLFPSTWHGKHVFPCLAGVACFLHSSQWMHVFPCTPKAACFPEFGIESS